MPPKRKAPSSSSTTTEDLTTSDPPTSINPYTVLSLPPTTILTPTSTPAEITRAYRLSALKFHPDKAPSASQHAEYTEKFQAIAFAYAILSDARRKTRYDTTGSTAESLLDLEDSDFDWTSYFRAQYSETLSAVSIEKFRSEYQSSDEERTDVLAAYTQFSGDMDRVFETVMCSDPLADEQRFRHIIDTAISQGEVKRFKKYSNSGSGSSDAARAKRRKAAEREAAEAEELAEELGVKEKLFGGKKEKKKGAEDDGQGSLMALIQARQKQREANSEEFFSRLEEKYGAGGGSKKSGKGKGKGKKAAGAAAKDEDGEDGMEDEDEGPDEAAFQATQARMEANRAKRMKVR